MFEGTRLGHRAQLGWAAGARKSFSGNRTKTSAAAMAAAPIQSIADLKRMQGALKTGDAVAFRALRNAGQGGEDWQAFFPAGSVPNK